MPDLVFAQADADDRVMAESAMLSVRGEARRTIAPDHLTVQCGFDVSATSKADALAQVNAAQQRLVGAMTELGGGVLTVETEREALTWFVGAVSTHQEHDFDKATGQHGPSGRVRAYAAIVVTLRDLSRIEDLSKTLFSMERLNTASVTWHVDRGNPAWRDVRAEAISAAIDKGRDYAAALGGSLVRVEHVADAGLLGSGADQFAARAVALSASALGANGPMDKPSLDPVPQEISAVVEARLVASVPPLA